MCVHNSLVGTGLRDRVRIGASGKVANGSDIVKRIIQGADYTNAARAMMMAVGCIQAQRCHTNTCPVGVATQDPKRARASMSATSRCACSRYQDATVRQASQLIALDGTAGPDRADAGRCCDAASTTTTMSYAELFDWLQPGELLHGPRAPGSTTGRRPTRTASERFNRGRLGTDPVRRHTHRAKENS